MNIKFDVDNKVITFETGVTTRQLQKGLDALVDNRTAIEDFKIEIGTVSNKTFITVEVPATYSWENSFKREWIEYKPVDKIKKDTNTNPVGILKKGVYYINIM